MTNCCSSLSLYSVFNAVWHTLCNSTELWRRRGGGGVDGAREDNINGRSLCFIYSSCIFRIPLLSGAVLHVVFCCQADPLLIQKTFPRVKRANQKRRARHRKVWHPRYRSDSTAFRCWPSSSDCCVTAQMGNSSRELERRTAAMVSSCGAQSDLK